MPGTAAKIIAHADAQMNHRIGLENRVIDANIRIEARGQVFAFIIALVVFFLGSFLIYTGKGAYGATIMGVDLATILSMFIVGQRAQTRALRDSANPFRPPVAKSK